VRIRYETTIDDLVAFNRFHCAHSPTVRRVRLLQMGFVAAVVIALAYAAAVVTGDYLILALGPVGAVVGVLLFPGAFRRHQDRQARKLYGEGANKGMLGPHELELSGGDLIERTPFGESRALLEVVERVTSDRGYTFIYVSAVMAHVIPHDAVIEGDPEAFVEAVRRLVAQRQAEPANRA
jgi:hypothetical protein